MVKSMKTTIENMIGSISNAGGNLQDYGFSTDRYGVMSVDKTVLNAKIDANPTNVKAFFTGGDYTNATTKRLDAKYAILKKKYTAYNTLINKFNASSNIFTQLANQRTTP